MNRMISNERNVSERLRQESEEKIRQRMSDLEGEKARSKQELEEERKRLEDQLREERTRN